MPVYFKIYQRGFTLIELLIVVSVIAILAGITVSIINPVAQRNRAQDGVLIASLDKIAVAVQAYEGQFFQVPSNITNSVNCDGTTNRCVILDQVNSPTYISTVDDGFGNLSVRFSIDGVNTGATNNAFIYQDFGISGGCVAAESNFSPGTNFFVWHPNSRQFNCTAADLAGACAADTTNTAVCSPLN